MNWVSIDFGTSYSAAAVLIDGEPVKVRPLGGLYDTCGFPTVAYVASPDDIKVCNAALPWRSQNPGRFLKDFKPDIHEDEIASLGVRYEDVIREILKHIRQSARYALGNEEAEGVILTVPASYAENDPRKETMRRAALAAGFSEVEFINEAEAAAAYYESIRRDSGESLSLVYDMGGGTFDAALVLHTPEGCRLLGSSTGHKCGGRYFEAALYRLFKSEGRLNFSEDETTRIRQMDAVSRACKEIKEGLTSEFEVRYPLPELDDTLIFAHRDDFEEAIRPMLEKTFQECGALVAASGKEWKDVDRVLLVGGSTAIRAVRTLLASYLTGQNRADMPVIFNKQKDGSYFDGLFAVSLGALLAKFPQEKVQKEITVPDPDDPRNLDDPLPAGEGLFDLACRRMTGTGIPKNLFLAEHYFFRDYAATGREESRGALMEIVRLFSDTLTVAHGNVYTDVNVTTVGEEAVDDLVTTLLLLESELKEMGEETFMEAIADPVYWLESIFHEDLSLISEPT